MVVLDITCKLEVKKIPTAEIYVKRRHFYQPGAFCLHSHILQPCVNFTIRKLPKLSGEINSALADS